MYICPKCTQKLNKDGISMRCEQNHCFDIARKGYINLLLSNGKAHGDSKEMLTCRREFLELGHYFPIVLKLTEIISGLGKSRITLLDAGCGEGYYTSHLREKLLESGIKADIYAIDVSKDAVALAARDKNISFSVASVNALPFNCDTFDVVISLFAPLNEEQFYRVLKKDGALITVSPSENHLFELKEKIYQNPLKNPPSTFENKALVKTDEESVEYKIQLSEQKDISNLFKMTPYYHKTSPADIQKALALTSLTTQIGFNFITYKK